MNDELYHYNHNHDRLGRFAKSPHGVKVAPNDSKILKKGTRINSVSLIKDSERLRNNNRWTYGFNPEDEWDSKVYRGQLGTFLYNRASRTVADPKVYEHQFEVAKDLKMPTREERVKEFTNLFETDRRQTIRDLKKYQKSMKRYKVGSEGARSVNLKKIRTNEDIENAYEIMGRAMTNVAAYKTTKKYKEIMSTKFDAMVDDNDQGRYFNVRDPIIVFKTRSALKTVGDARVIDIMERFNDVTYVHKTYVNANKGAKK